MDQINHRIASESSIVCISHKISNFSKEVGFKVQEIRIEQYPEENLSLEMTISKPQMCRSCCSYIVRTGRFSVSNNCFTCTSRTFNLRLLFCNYLHFMSTEYEYEVSCKLLGKDTEVFLFSNKLQRTSNNETFTAVAKIDNYLYNVPGGTIIHLEIRRNRVSSTDQNIKQLQDFYSQLFLTNEKSENVSINVSGKSYNVSKQVLSLKSPVFKAMFSHETYESKNGVIDIVDFDSDTIEYVLHYIYSKETKNVHQRAEDIYKAAHKYEIKDLQNECIEWFKFNICPENFVRILKVAKCYELDELIRGIDRFISFYEADLVKRENYQDFLIENLELGTVIGTLELCDKYHSELHDVKMVTFQFLEQNLMEVVELDGYHEFLGRSKRMTKEIFQYLCRLDDSEERKMNNTF